MLAVRATDTILIFTDKGNCVKITADKIPEGKWREKGITLKSIDRSIDIMETPIAVMKAEEDGEVAFFTQNGNIKRSQMKEIIVAKTYYQAIKLSDDDKLISVEKELKGKAFIFFTKFGNVSSFEKGEVPIQGRIAGGVKAINLDDKDQVVFAGQTISDDYLVVTNNGFVKRLSALQIPIGSRARKGVKYINFDKGGKSVVYVGIKDKCVVDQGLKFSILEKAKLKVSSDRLSVGNEEIKKKFLSVYQFVD